MGSTANLATAGPTNFESDFSLFAGRRKPLHLIAQAELNEHDAKITQLHIDLARVKRIP
jgi:hypothetical protein